MSKKIYTEMATALNIKKKITKDSNLRDFSEWDSMGALTIIGFADAKYKRVINGDQLHKCKTFGDIVKLFND
jgi:acyl carrier protein